MELSLQDIEAGSVINPPGITLKEEIGRGRSGWVYKGSYDTSEPEVSVSPGKCAIKILVAKKERLDKESLEKELKKLVSLKKAQFPKYMGWYRWGNEKEYIYIIVMEHIDGEPLRKCDITPETALKMIEQIAGYHKEGVTHKNIALQNFLIDQTGNIYLVDVGLEAYTHEFMEMREEKELPPEIIEGTVDPKKFESVDIWALGHVLKGTTISPEIVKALQTKEPKERMGLEAASAEIRESLQSS